MIPTPGPTRQAVPRPTHEVVPRQVVFAVIFGLQWSMATNRTVLALVLILVLVLLTVLTGVQVFKGFRGILRQGEEEARKNPRPW